MHPDRISDKIDFQDIFEESRKRSSKMEATALER